MRLSGLADGSGHYSYFCVSSGHFPLTLLGGSFPGLEQFPGRHALVATQLCIQGRTTAALQVLCEWCVPLWSLSWDLQMPGSPRTPSSVSSTSRVSWDPPGFPFPHLWLETWDKLDDPPRLLWPGASLPLCCILYSLTLMLSNFLVYSPSC